MCDLEKEFKLCTCDFDTSKAKYTWKLFRKRSTSCMVIMGEYFVSYLDWTTISLSEKVEFYINEIKNEKLFDKPISLQDNDRLVFYEKDELLFQFEYIMCRWGLLNSKKEPKFKTIQNGGITISSKTITKSNFFSGL